MSRLKRHTLVVEIECDDAQGSHDAETRLLRWLETFGHTSFGHGFTFFKVGRIAGKAMKGRTAREGMPRPTE
jgi:hypothetical protein